MKVCFGKTLTLSETKKLLKTIKAEGGTITRASSDVLKIVDNRNRSHLINFNTNLKLRGLV